MRGLPAPSSPRKVGRKAKTGLSRLSSRLAGGVGDRSVPDIGYIVHN